MVKVNKLEKDMVLKYFPNTKFIRTCKNKSRKHHYYMVEEKDQLRFLSGMNKTVKDFTTNKINVVVKGAPIINVEAIKAFDILLSNNIKYYRGSLGGMSQNGEVLSNEDVERNQGIRRFCEFELSDLRKKYKNILTKQLR